MLFACFNHTRQMLVLIRLGQKLRKIKCGGKFLSTMVEYIVRIIFSSDISCAARIGEDVIFVHGHDIVIGQGVVIGRCCKIFNGVTLGNKDTEDSTNIIGQPTIGDECVISTGAKILGSVRIGSGSIIGANAVVISDVPPNSIAVGVPARVMPRDKDLRENLDASILLQNLSNSGDYDLYRRNKAG